MKTPSVATITSLIVVVVAFTSGGCASYNSTYTSRSVGDRVVVDATGEAAVAAASVNTSHVGIGNNPYRSSSSYSNQRNNIDRLEDTVYSGVNSALNRTINKLIYSF
jgi:hypothetical protein